MSSPFFSREVMKRLGDSLKKLRGDFDLSDGQLASALRSFADGPMAQEKKAKFERAGVNKWMKHPDSRSVTPEQWEIFLELFPELRSEIAISMLRWLMRGNEPWIPDGKTATAEQLQQIYSHCQFYVPPSVDLFSFFRMSAKVLLDQIRASGVEPVVAISGGTTQSQMTGPLQFCADRCRPPWSSDTKPSFVALNDVQRNDQGQKSSENIVIAWAKILGGKALTIPMDPDPKLSAMKYYRNLVRDPDVVVLGAGGPSSYTASVLTQEPIPGSPGDLGYLPLDMEGKEKGLKSLSCHRQYLSIKALREWQGSGGDGTRVRRVVAVIPDPPPAAGRTKASATQPHKSAITKVILEKQLVNHMCVGHELAQWLLKTTGR